MNAGSEIWALARALERDRYLAALRTPRRYRDALMTLAAFAAELARVPDLVSEPMLGEIRLQWWREAVGLAGSAEAQLGHPVADQMRRIVAERGLPGGLIAGLIDAAALELSGEPMPDMTALTARLAKTEGALFDLSARILGAGYSEKLALAAGHAGTAYGLARLLHDLPAELARGRVRLPVELLKLHDIEPHALLAGHPGPGYGALIADLAVRARQAQQAALPAVALLERDLRPAFLPLAMVDVYLEAAAAQAVAGPGTQHNINPLRQVWCIWRGPSRN